MTALDEIQPGDVLVVRTPPGNWLINLAARLIRLGAALHDEPDLGNHVVIAHHRDGHGVLWGIEGRPGGVGWVDCAEYANPYLIANTDQPKTPDQRAAITAAAEALLGVAYDWAAIGMDALEALCMDRLWQPHHDTGRVPGHVVCSSLATWVYRRVGLPAPPGNWHTTTPGDWARWILEQAWTRPRG